MAVQIATFETLRLEAEAAEKRQDWEGALKFWAEAKDVSPDDPAGYVGVGLALQMRKCFDEADVLLRSAIDRFPAHSGIAVEYARVAHRRADWPEALARWQVVLERFPNTIHAALGAAMALRSLRQFEALDAFLKDVVPRFPNNAALAFDYGKVAEELGDAAEAVRRFEAAHEKFPLDGNIQRGLGSARFSKQLGRVERDGGDEKPNAPESTGKSRRDLSTPAAVMMQFESLGSGCEFGLVQRHFGAEPLGLLRWGAIPSAALVRALDKRFEGLGRPETAELFEFRKSGEYFFRDNSFSMEMHTFIPIRGDDYARVFDRLCRRVRYMADKLLEDLENPDELSKIFIYKHHNKSLSDGEIRALHKAIRRYGAHNLLCVQPIDEGHEDCSVEKIDDGLFIGYIDGLTFDVKAMKYDSWMTVCKTVCGLV